jgi:succinate dehydrogenase / fumarate reductase flavoprotein subunit/L-aspartate oxidase
MVFGKRSGTEAASRVSSMPHGRLTLDHLTRFRAEAKKAGGTGAITSPMLFPDYTRRET